MAEQVSEDRMSTPGIDFEYTPRFDLLSMTPEQVDALAQDYHRGEVEGYDHHIGYLLAPAAVRDALIYPDELLRTPSDNLAMDLIALAGQDFEHGRAVLEHLAESTDEMSRSFSTEALGHLILAGERAGVSRGIILDLTETLLRLLHDSGVLSGGDISEDAYFAVCAVGRNPEISDGTKGHMISRLAGGVAFGVSGIERVPVYDYTEPTFPPA